MLNRNLTLLYIAFSFLSVAVGCENSTQNAIYPKQAVSTGSKSHGIVFEQLIYDQNINSDSRHVTFDIPFTIKGDEPVVISSIDKSCQCTKVGDGVIGKKLYPGKQYNLSTEIDLETGTGYNTVLIIRTEQKDRIQLLLRGVRETVPTALPEKIICKFIPGKQEHASGKFEVFRIRDPDNPPLVPSEMEVVGKHFKITFIDRVERIQPIKGGMSLSATNEALRWKWEIKTELVDPADEEILINWKDTNLPPTKIMFHCSAKPLMQGLVSELNCGAIRPNEIFQHSINLYKAMEKAGGIKKIHCDSSDVSFRIEEINSSITRIHVEVRGPQTPGEFTIPCQIEWGQSSAPISDLKLYGIVQ